MGQLTHVIVTRQTVGGGKQKEEEVHREGEQSGHYGQTVVGGGTVSLEGEGGGSVQYRTAWV